CLQAQVETLLATSKAQEVINEAPISTANISTPPESPCNSRPSSDLFNEMTSESNSITDGIISGENEAANEEERHEVAEEIVVDDG
ncbi:13257_t:CDS:2, partial [Racocetra fulgida]